MSSRNNILERIKACKIDAVEMPRLDLFGGSYENLKDKFIAIFKAGGGFVSSITDMIEIAGFIKHRFPKSERIVSSIKELNNFSEIVNPENDPHTYNDVDIAIIYGQFAIAENGAVWITEAQMVQRIIPFICQHLFVIIRENDIVPTMHEAYKKNNDTDYGYGCFISGPSKSADIEQSLVLGAHGPLSMTVLILE